MKKMIIVAFTLLVAMGAVAQGPKKAHNGKGIEARAKKSADWINEQVKLAPDQYTKVYNAQLESFKKLVAIKRDTSIAKDAAKVQARQVKKSAVDQIKAILTPEQFETLTAKLKEKHELKKAKKGEKKGKAGGVEKDIEDELLN
ncbi:MAG: hypothetical protein SGJ10_02060 [Bacteroidota bacterium]|nr:hypothetical protein [Bacteroidota bacterium]